MHARIWWRIEHFNFNDFLGLIYLVYIQKKKIASFHIANKSE